MSPYYSIFLIGDKGFFDRVAAMSVTVYELLDFND